MIGADQSISLDGLIFYRAGLGSGDSFKALDTISERRGERKGIC